MWRRRGYIEGKIKSSIFFFSIPAIDIQAHFIILFDDISIISIVQSRYTDDRRRDDGVSREERRVDAEGDSGIFVQISIFPRAFREHRREDAHMEREPDARVQFLLSYSVLHDEAVDYI